MAKILIIEDDNDINNLLNELLSHKYLVTQAFSGTEGLRLVKETRFDLIVMDLMLPVLNGEDLIPKVKETYDVPIIVLTAKAGVSNLVEVLALGADDYIAKPFHNQELLARVEVRLRQHSDISDILILGNLSYDNHEVKVNHEILNLTQKERMILKIMLENPGRVYTKAHLYEAVWQDTYYGDDNTISVHISRLRTKLEEANCDVKLETIWGIGFKLVI